MTGSINNSDAGSPTVTGDWQYTRCPECEAVFRVDQAKLSVRKGEVRCGACRIVFHAPSHKVFRNHGGGFSALISDMAEQKEAVEEMITTRESIEGELEVPENDPFSAEFTAPIDPILESSSLFSEASPQMGEAEEKASERLFNDSTPGERKEFEGDHKFEETKTLESGVSARDIELNARPVIENFAVEQVAKGSEDHFFDTQRELSKPEVHEDNLASEGSAERELFIPKVSSEPLVSRDSRDEEKIRKEPVFFGELDFGSLQKEPPVNTQYDARLDAMADTGISKSESLEKARESLLFHPVSDEDTGPRNTDSLASSEMPGLANEKSEWNDSEIQPYGASAMPMPPRFEPLVNTATEPEGGIEKSPLGVSQNRWSDVEDSLLDHNPFPPPDAESVGAVPEIKVEPKPTAINMSGVDEYIVDRPNPLAGFFWFLVSAAFVVLLGLQVKYFFVERFAQNEVYRPYLQVFCSVARCELPPRRDAYRFTITQTRVDLHPQEPGALRITVRLLNQAKFAQPYPELRLTLTDRVGRVVGRRKFHPEFYLPSGAATRLASGELGYVVFDLARPHEKAVGFVVDVVRRTS
ncbi:MAG: zinc-ribbon and DUF3426 domain-containing protein [Acidiferrobacterales bacterium]|nr:zinc-ribbon and DUF3426 domain-containing protein [Acidiferrobacterales bacterium]